MVMGSEKTVTYLSHCAIWDETLQESTVTASSQYRPEGAAVLPVQGTALGIVAAINRFDRSNGPIIRRICWGTFGPLGRFLT